MGHAQSINAEWRSKSMCQLMGMNCNVATDICFSFRGFHQRGG